MTAAVSLRIECRIEEKKNNLRLIQSQNIFGSDDILHMSVPHHITCQDVLTTFFDRPHDEPPPHIKLLNVRQTAQVDGSSTPAKEVHIQGGVDSQNRAFVNN